MDLRAAVDLLGLLLEFQLGLHEADVLLQACAHLPNLVVEEQQEEKRRGGRGDLLPDSLWNRVFTCCKLLDSKSSISE